MTTDEIIKIGQAARRFLSDEYMQMLMAEMQKKLHDQIENVQTNDTAIIMSCVNQLRAIRVIKGNMENYAASAERLLNQ